VGVAVTSKLRVKLGRLELDFEGSEDFIKQELMTVLAQLKTLGALDIDGDDDAGGDGKPKSKVKLDDELTTSTIAGKIGVDSGPELVMAAMIRLTMVGNAAKATREAITAEMRGATAYFKETYTNNLTSTLRRLVTGQRLNDLGSNSYSIPAPERTKLEAKIAGQQ
jgi:hypothetical protein